ncbi:MAG: HlyD family efflux transporter periplasmic adaptor subunit [Spirulina sp. SIO3F2]|nr:HlyD family efflux transporter periplasmic adaptor subunit [Spirulina sp. SIO3F2]
MTSTSELAPTCVPALPSSVVSKPSPQPWVLWLLPLALFPTGVFTARHSFIANAEPTPLATTLSVTTQPAQAINSYTVQRTYTGEITAQRTSELGFERSGTVVTLLADEGDRVAAGQPLARLDIRNLQARRQERVAQRAQAQAQLQELQNGPRSEDISAAQAAVWELEQELERAKRQRDRRQFLYDEGAIAYEDFDDAAYNTAILEQRLARAKSDLQELNNGTRSEQIIAQHARVQQLDAQIQALDVDISKSVIYAPFAGKVSDRPIDEGVVVGSGATVVTLVEQGNLEARIGVPEDRVSQLKVGGAQKVQIGDNTYRATVTAQLPEVDETSRTVTVVLQLPADVATQVGQTARLLFADIEPTDGVWVPSTALVPGDRGLWSVYVLGDANNSENNSTYAVARRDVEVLHTEGDRTLVRGTIQGQDQVITNGTHRVVTRQTVQVTSE